MTEKYWLERNRFYYQIDEARLQSIFYFSLIWNIYEKKLCNKYGIFKVHPNEHSQKYSEKIDSDILNTVFAYFKNRYVSNGKPTEHYISFEFKSESIKSEVFEYLNSENPVNEQKLKSLLLIAFRLRNNLFHGEKEVERLYEQNENFSQINFLLMNLIDNK